jgi:hypothetical protein
MSKLAISIAADAALATLLSAVNAAAAAAAAPGPTADLISPPAIPPWADN